MRPFQLGLKMFMECSAKTGENVDAAYIQLALMVKHRLIDSNADYQAGMGWCPMQCLLVNAVHPYSLG